MLCLSLKPGDRVVMGESGEIVFALDAKETRQVRIMIDAPREIPIYRGKIWDDLQRQKRDERRAP